MFTRAMVSNPGAMPTWRIGSTDVFWLLVLLVLGGMFWLPGLGQRGLWTSGEARAAQVARRMVATGDYITQRQQKREMRLTVAGPHGDDALTYDPDGKTVVYDHDWRATLLQHMSTKPVRADIPFEELITIHKPVLYYWLIAIAHRVGMDINAASIRCFSAVPAMLLLGATYLLGCVLYERRVGLLAALALATCVQFWWQARICQMDMLLTLMMAAVFLLWYLGDRSPSSGARFFTFAGVYLLLAAASLMKSFAYMLLPGLIILVYLVVETFMLHERSDWVRAYAGRVRQVMQRMHILTGLVVYLLLVVPWFVLIHQATDGQFTQRIFLHHMFSRAGLMQVGREFEEKTEWWFYLARIWVDMFPWVIMIPGAVVQVFRIRCRDTWRSGAYLLCWLVVWFMFFSALRFRKNEYILPLYPAAMILVAKMLVDYVRDQLADRHLGRAIRSAFVGLAVGVALAGAFALALMSERVVEWILTEPLIDGSPIFGSNLNDATILRSFAGLLREHPAVSVFGLSLIAAAMLVASVSVYRRRAGIALGLLAAGTAGGMLMATNLLMDRLIDPHRSQRVFAKQLEIHARRFGADKRMVLFASEQHELVYLLPDRFDAVIGIKPAVGSSLRVDPLYALKCRLAAESTPTLVVMERKIWDLIVGTARTLRLQDPYIDRLEEVPLGLDEEYNRCHREPLVLLRFDSPS